MREGPGTSIRLGEVTKRGIASLETSWGVRRGHTERPLRRRCGGITKAVGV